MVWPLPATSAPAPIRTDFADDAILALLPDAPPRDTQVPSSAGAMADEVQTLIDQARGTGDPRFLGYAERRLQLWPDDAMTDRLRVLRATLAQSLHRFDPARQDLLTVINQGTDRRQRIQARLTLANLETVQGHYGPARDQCQRLSTEYPGLIAASCLAQVNARSGDARAAYERLTARLLASGNKESVGYLWAQGTLGDIAAQLGLTAAGPHWQAVLAGNPDDLYVRTQLADWHLRDHQFESVLALTRGYEQVDALAVLRAIAMQETGHPGKEALADRLRERFKEAQWRGALLHKRDFARFQLAIEQKPATALRYAMASWQTQREPLDTALALRAALAADDQTALHTLQSWLATTGQSDARYPEVP